MIWTFCSLRLPPVLPIGETYESEASCEWAARVEAESDGSSQYLFAHDGRGATWRYVREVEARPDEETARGNDEERAWLTNTVP